jgi:hypothetical protein
MTRSWGLILVVKPGAVTAGTLGLRTGRRLLAGDRGSLGRAAGLVMPTIFALSRVDRNA